MWFIKTCFVVCLLLFSTFSIAQEGVLTKADQAPVYIDVRTWFEHKLNNIEGDPRIHISGLVKGVEKQFPDKSTPIRLYCAAGVRSGRGVQKLREAGYLDVQNVGGINEVKKRRFGTFESAVQ